MKLKKTDDGFKIYIGGKKLIHHSADNPCMYVGKGSALYEMHLGNFYIEDEIIEKVALKDFHIERTGERIFITFSRGNLFSVKTLFIEQKGRLIIKFIENGDMINRLWIRIAAQKGEHIYGCGEQFSCFDLRGRKFPLWVSEQGVGRNKKTETTFLADCMDGAGGDYYTTYFPQPTFVSSDKYFCHVVDSCYMEFNFENETYHELEIWGVPEEIIFVKKDNFVDILEEMTDSLGRQPLLPSWVYDGVWLGIQGGTDVIFEKLEKALDNDVKVSAIWAQDWQGKRITYFGKRLMWDWEWDRKLYPDLDKKIKLLNERGIKFLGYINPYLAVEGNLFAQARDKGYLVKDNTGEDYVFDAGAFMIGIVDLTNPEAFKWYKEVIKKNMIEFGLSGWMADFGEYLPTDAVLYNGISAEKMHNLWPVLWAKCNREAIEESGKLGEIVFFTRSGYSGTGRYSTMMWAGDQNVDWSLDDGLPSVIIAALSLGMSGYGLHHSDIGGYTTLFDMKRTKELFMRWVEMSAFSPVMRTHEGNRPDTNWQFDSDEETLLHFARMSNIYKMLSPYIEQQVMENSKKGIPVMRPLFLHYEKDEMSYIAKYQFLMGRDLLVAPVYEENKCTRKLYLPKDEWVHLWTEKEYRGGEIEVEAPIGFPPVFYRKSSPYIKLFKEISRI